MPLANDIRSKNISEIIGQKHLVGSGKVIDRMLETNHLINMIFYGPPGTGKTTMASIIAKHANMTFRKLNATNDSMKDLREAIEETNTLMGNKGILLYIDEIHHFTKRIQQTLLEYIENGSITLIGSTTENPYYYVFKGVLSRCVVLEFKSLNRDDIEQGIKKAIKYLEKKHDCKVKLEEEIYKYIYNICDGDMRRGINLIEVVFYAKFREENINIGIKDIEEISSIKSMNFDTKGDVHYGLLSAFQKSIRGSDANAAIYYLAILIKGGDLESIARRLMVIACEDVGLAYPQAIPIIKSCVDIAREVGFPEAKIPLADAVILLATAPKSNSGEMAIEKAMEDINNNAIGTIPDYLINNKPSKVKYKYPHDFPNNYVKQEYLPKEYKDKKYYVPGKNKFEQYAENFWKNIK